MIVSDQKHWIPLDIKVDNIVRELDKSVVSFDAWIVIKRHEFDNEYMQVVEATSFYPMGWELKSLIYDTVQGYDHDKEMHRNEEFEIDVKGIEIDIFKDDDIEMDFQAYFNIKAVNSTKSIKTPFALSQTIWEYVIDEAQREYMKAVR